MAIDRSALKQLAGYLWELPREYHPGMRVPARIYALEPLLDPILVDKSVDQLINVACLPGIVKASMVMPDVHEGYGFPIGGVAATRYPSGVISPGGIGYDINCGVRLMISTLRYDQIKNHLEALAKAMYNHVPSGVGRGGTFKLNLKEMDRVLRLGAEWALEEGSATQNDLLHTESHGRLRDANPDKVSLSAKERGSDQLGTIGAGNHFVEVDRVDTIFHPEAAKAYGLSKDQIVILIHTGSRGLGHQVATDHLRVMMSAMSKYDIKLPDRELACVPFDSPEGQDYYHAMCAAANFAWCNRQIITHQCRRAWQEMFGKKDGKLQLLYDVAHNIAKLEDHVVDGEPMRLIVHRKGATRAFGPRFPEIPADYRGIGQPVLIPGSMGTASYVLAGTEASMEATFGSTCHGAGRRMSRTAARKNVDAKQLKASLLKKGIHVEAGSEKGISEEAPIAYKDVDLVVETVHQAGIALKVAKLKPICVVKG